MRPEVLATVPDQQTRNKDAHRLEGSFGDHFTPLFALKLLLRLAADQ